MTNTEIPYREGILPLGVYLKILKACPYKIHILSQYNCSHKQYNDVSLSITVKKLKQLKCSPTDDKPPAHEIGHIIQWNVIQ